MSKLLLLCLKQRSLSHQIDKVITLGKKNNLQSKKNLIAELQSKTSVEKLFKILSQRYQNRKGGYSRVIRAGFRYGDNAPMAVIELVDRDTNAKKIDIKKKLRKLQKQHLKIKQKKLKKKLNPKNKLFMK